MQTYYSIISVPLNAYLGERVSVGLVMFNSEDSRLKFSFEKLSVIKDLIPEKYYFLKSYFKQMQNDLANHKKDIFLENKNPNWISNSYVSYLNRYSNNSLEFSEPRAISIEMSKETFIKFFEKYVYEYVEERNSIRHNSITSIVRHELYNKIEPKVNLNLTVTNQDFHELFTPVEIDFVGKNGVLVAGQTIDFEKKTYYLDSDLSKYITFTQAANYSEHKEGQYFVIGREPKKIYEQQHLTWKNIRQNKFVDYIDVSETQRIEDYLKDHGVKPLYSKEKASN